MLLVVLCRFVESLNNYYHATYDRRYEVSDYFEYCFRKVGSLLQLHLVGACRPFAYLSFHGRRTCL